MDFLYTDFFGTHFSTNSSYTDFFIYRLFFNYWVHLLNNDTFKSDTKRIGMCSDAIHKGGDDTQQ